MAVQPRLREKPEEEEPQKVQDPVGITVLNSMLSVLALSIRFWRLFKLTRNVPLMVLPAIQITGSAITTPLIVKGLGNHHVAESTLV